MSGNNKSIFTWRCAIIPLIFLSAILLFPNRLFGQAGIPVNFLVKTSDNDTIREVIVSIHYRDKATAETVSRGRAFTVTIDTTRISEITFFAVGYATETWSGRQVTSATRGNPGGTYHVILKRKKVELGEVVIHATPVEPFFQRQNLLVVDYELLANGNLLLVGDGQIYLVSGNDSLLDAVPNRQHIDSIILDCTGKLFLKNSTGLFPAHVRKTKLLIAEKPLPGKEALSLLLDIKACNHYLRLKERVGSFNQQVFYFVEMTEKPHTTFLLYAAQDSSRIRLAAAHGQEISSMKVADHMGELKPGQLRAIREKMQQQWYYDFFITKKLYSPVFIFGDTIYIFDHAARRVNTFSYRLRADSVLFYKLRSDSITYMDSPGWKNEILLDRQQGRFYTVYQDRGVLLSPLTPGHRTGEAIRLPGQHYFVEKLKVFDRGVYYLWKDPYKPGANKTLYKFRAGGTE